MNNQAENDTKNEKQKSIPEEKTIETKHSIAEFEYVDAGSMFTQDIRF